MSINIMGLILGFAGLLMVLLYLNDEQSYNTNNPHKEEVFRVIHKGSDGSFLPFTNPVEGPTFKDEIPEITAYYLSDNWYSSSVVKTNGKEQFTENILRGSPAFFDFFPSIIIKEVQINLKKQEIVLLFQKNRQIYYLELNLQLVKC